MVKEQKLSRSLLIVATIALYVLMTQSAAARGGGHGGGGGHHGGGGHRGGGGHHGSHNHHPYHPSHHHSEHHHHSSHHDDHHHDHHYAHHHEDWHHGGWGPGFWGGTALGYGLGYGYGNWNGWSDGGGDTYVDNTTNVTPADNDSGNDSESDDNDSDDASDSGDQDNPAENSAADQEGDEGFPTDNWPELGAVTYAGEYGGSQGQVLMDIVPGSAADKAGLVPGDVILTFNGKPVPSANDLDEALDTARGKFDVEVWDARTGRKSNLNGLLDPAEAKPASEPAATPAQQ